MRRRPTTPSQNPELLSSKSSQIALLLLLMLAEGCAHGPTVMTEDECQDHKHHAARHFKGKPGYRVIDDHREGVSWILHRRTGQDIPVFGVITQFNQETGQCEEVLYTPEGLCNDGRMLINNVGEDGYHTKVQISDTCHNAEAEDYDPNDETIPLGINRFMESSEDKE